MNRWTHVVPLPSYSWLPKPLLARQKKLNARIEELTAGRATCEAERQSLAVASVESINPQQVAPLEVKAARASDRFGLLQLESILRCDLAEYFAEQTAARRKARDEAEAAHEQVRADVRQKLTAIGYVDADTPQPGWITPAMVLGHPVVLETRLRVEELADDDDYPCLNRVAFDAITQELEAIRRAAVGPF